MYKQAIEAIDPHSFAALDYFAALWYDHLRGNIDPEVDLKALPVLLPESPIASKDLFQILTALMKNMKKNAFATFFCAIIISKQRVHKKLLMAMDTPGTICHKLPQKLFAFT